MNGQLIHERPRLLTVQPAAILLRQQIYQFRIVCTRPAARVQIFHDSGRDTVPCSERSEVGRHRSVAHLNQCRTIRSRIAECPHTPKMWCALEMEQVLAP